VHRGENSRGSRKDHAAARLTRGTQPGRANGSGKRFGKEDQPKKRGRPKGARNYFTREIQEALLRAVNRYGQDGRGKDGLEGFFFKMCGEQPLSVMGMLRAQMPTQVTVERRGQPKQYKSLDEVRRELAQRGINIDPVFQLEHHKGPLIELDADDVSERKAGESKEDAGE
jgi:hypothetical protein